jgi:hypothetical protein
VRGDDGVGAVELAPDFVAVLLQYAADVLVRDGVARDLDAFRRVAVVVPGDAIEKLLVYARRI